MYCIAQWPYSLLLKTGCVDNITDKTYGFWQQKPFLFQALVQRQINKSVISATG